MLKFEKIVRAQWWQQDWFWLTGIVVVGLGLRLINLSQQPYWSDELLGLGIVRHFNKLGELVAYLRWVEIHPPLYYVLLHYWVGWFGASTLATRLLSTIFGLGVIVLAYKLGQRLFNKHMRLGLVAAFLVAILPIQIQYSQETRPYILFCFFALLAVFFLWEYLVKSRVSFLIWYALVNIVGLYIHYSYAYAVIALALAWLIDAVLRRRTISFHHELFKWCVTHAVVALGFMWWLDAFLYKLLLGKFEIFGLVRVQNMQRGIEFFGSTMNQLIWLTQHARIPALVVLVVWVFKSVLVGVIAYLLIRVESRIKTSLQTDARSLIFITVLVVVPLVLFLLSPDSTTYTSIYERHVVQVSVLLILLLCWLFYQLPLKLRSVMVSLFCLSLMNFTLIVMQNDSVWNIEYQDSLFAKYINQQYRPGDLVIVDKVSFRSNFNFYLRPELSARGVYPLTLYDNDFMRSRDTLGLAENEFQLRADLETRSLPTEFVQRLVAEKLQHLISQNHAQRVWLVATNNDTYINMWFSGAHWRHAFVSIGQLFPVDLYVRPAVNNK